MASPLDGDGKSTCPLSPEVRRAECMYEAPGMGGAHYLFTAPFSPAPFKYGFTSVFELRSLALGTYNSPLQTDGEVSGMVGGKGLL